MLEPSVLASVRKYLASHAAQGIAVERAVVFGSQVKGRADEWSDIDLLVISPQFDGLKDRNTVNLLWRVAARVDSRIEPIPRGSRQWLEDDGNAVVEIARSEGSRTATHRSCRRIRAGARLKASDYAKAAWAVLLTGRFFSIWKMIPELIRAIWPMTA